jgi:chaperone BCS1
MGRRFVGIKSPISPAQYESYLSCFKTSPRAALDNIKVLEDIVESEHRLRHIGKTIIYRYNCREWEPFDKPHAKRPFKTVVTQKGIKEDLLDDILQFQQDEDWYIEHGIPYRRGYLLHGPPGTGKSSLVYSLAGKLDYGICLLNLSDKDLTDNGLMRSLAKVPNKSFVLIEDIDMALPSKKRKKDMDFAKEKGEEVMQTNLTLSGVLNAIDGVASEDSQILFMTTNFKQHLDAALVRPGRVDREFYLDNCNTTQTKDIFSNFFPHANREEVNKMGQIFESIQAPISPAQLQGYLMRYKKSSSDALENVQVLKDSVELADEDDYCVDSGCVSTQGDSKEDVNDVGANKDNDETKDSQERKEVADRSL